MLLNKPFQVLSQFSDDEGRTVLADFVDLPDVYPAGRLDYNSEGLLLLTDDGRLQARISEADNKLAKHYWVQVDGTATDAQLHGLESGVVLKDGPAHAESARLMNEPAGLWERFPPIRVRQSLPTSWIEVVIAEGRNRQVRRMTAAVNLPTLRLVRHRVGPFVLDGLKPGECRVMDNETAWAELREWQAL